MAGSFGSINTALSGLRYNQVALDVAGNNIANANTEGYVRRQVVGASVGVTQAALWSRTESRGEGVAIGEVRRMIDPLLEARVRREHADLSSVSTRATVMGRLEEGVGEPGPNGVHAAMLDLRNAWQDLAVNPGGSAARQQVLGRAETLAQALRVQAGNVGREEAHQRTHALNVVSEINTGAADLAKLNGDIQALQINGTDAGVLLDKRDQLALRLAELAGAVTTVRPDGQYDIAVGGVSLVQGRNAGTLVVDSGITTAGDADGAALRYRIDGGSGSTLLPAGTGGPGGELGGVTEVLTTGLPSYRAGLDAVAADLAATINAQQAAGYDASGTPGAPIFGYDPAQGAAGLTVVMTDGAQIAASALPGGALDGSNADLASRAGTYPDAYQRLVNGLGTDVAALERRTANQTSLTGALDSARDQLAGVNLDEEAVNMVTAQRAYEAAARLMTTLDDMLDTLINRTGLVGR